MDKHTLDIKAIIKESAEIKLHLIKDEEQIAAVRDVVNETIDCYKNGGKTLFCGNGGSAADAQHLAAELSGRFYKDRDPLFAEALHVNTSYITAVANDYDYSEIYSRIIKAKGVKGDVLFAFSTSGNSENIIRALEQAKIQGMITVGLTGDGGGKMASLCNHLIKIPSNSTPRIQESHILIGHIICQLTEEALF